MDRVRADLFLRPGTRSVVLAHAFVSGGLASESERDICVGGVDLVPASVFDGVDYVALGHLHRRQPVLGPCPVHYSGAPLAIDFGEEENTPSVTIVEVSPDTAAKTREFPVISLVTANVTASRISRYSTAKPACCNSAEPRAISRAMAVGSCANAAEMLCKTRA